MNNKSKMVMISVEDLANYVKTREAKAQLELIERNKPYGNSDFLRRTEKRLKNEINELEEGCDCTERRHHEPVRVSKVRNNAIIIPAFDLVNEDFSQIQQFIVSKS